MSIEFDGMKEVLDSLEACVDEETINKALTKACLVVEARAKQLAPKGIGDLRRSITSKVEDLQGVVYTPLEYAPYVEYGTGIFAENGGRTDVPWNYKDDEGNWHTTSGMPPRPYMRPALDESRETIIRILREGLTSD